MFLSMSYKTMRVPLDELITLSQPNSQTFLPQCGFEILNLTFGQEYYKHQSITSSPHQY